MNRGSSHCMNPASGEIESLLFTLQGSLGAAVIFYILGYSKGRQRRDDRA